MTSNGRNGKHGTSGSRPASRPYRIGIDVGGTFTDLVVWSKEGGLSSHKVLTTPKDPSEGVVAGLAVAAKARGEEPKAFARRVSTIVHGTTVTTNATLTRGGAKTGLVTTKGVRDALEMRRGIREEPYDNRFQNVVPLVPRWLRRPVAGRIDAAGNEIESLAVPDVTEAAALFAKEGVEAVAVCFMNSFGNAAHERAAAKELARALPGAFQSVSSDVLPTVRFYDRVSTTCLNAYVGPILDRYLAGLTTRLAEAGFEGVLLVMQSNGGVARPDAVRRKPATTLLSGPAAGPRAGAAVVKPLGTSDAIVVDMGGTSFDASLVRGGAAALEREGEIDRLRIALPMLAITTIGAGGGSIGWIDEGGLLRMGPMSAGALPGPACYGRGGEKPTCTDANVVLGYLDPRYFAGGEMVLDAAKARAAVEAHVAKPLRMSVEEAAAGMVRVIDANMAGGVREITVKRGLDPREFPLVVAGGAGGMHACMIARDLSIPTVVVPRTASVLCAAGMLMSDLQHDQVRSYVVAFRDLDRRRLANLVREMEAEGAGQLRDEGVPAANSNHLPFLDLRYVKQYHEVTVPIAPAAIAKGDLAAVAKAFHAEHNRLYGYDLSKEGTELELINVRVRSIGRTESLSLPEAEAGGRSPEGALKGRRRAWVPETRRFAALPVYDGHALKAGNRFEGPALVERTDTTVLVSRAYRARVDALGSLVIEARRS